MVKWLVQRHKRDLISTESYRQEACKQQQLEAGMEHQATKGPPGWEPGQRGLPLGPPIVQCAGSSLPGLRCTALPLPALHQINTLTFVPNVTHILTSYILHHARMHHTDMLTSCLEAQTMV